MAMTFGYLIVFFTVWGNFHSFTCQNSEDYRRLDFSCLGRPPGYYADVSTGCRVYHLCESGGRKYTYTCPNMTLFQQRMMICNHWYTVDCSVAENDYSANLLIGQKDKPFVSESEHLNSYKESLNRRNLNLSYPKAFQRFHEFEKNNSSNSQNRTVEFMKTKNDAFRAPPLSLRLRNKEQVVNNVYNTQGNLPEEKSPKQIVRKQNSEHSFEGFPKDINRHFAPNPIGNSFPKFNVETADKFNRMPKDIVEPSAGGETNDFEEPQSMRSSEIGRNVIEIQVPDYRRMFYIAQPRDSQPIPTVEHKTLIIHLLPPPEDEATSMKFKGYHDEEQRCPGCYPAFLLPGKCEPCIKIR